VRSVGPENPTGRPVCRCVSIEGKPLRWPDAVVAATARQHNRGISAGICGKISARKVRVLAGARGGSRQGVLSMLPGSGTELKSCGESYSQPGDIAGPETARQRSPSPPCWPAVLDRCNSLKRTMSEPLSPAFAATVSSAHT
jgi:hypothetical protein